MTIHTIMTADESGKELVDFAEKLAHRLVNAELKRSQIRTIFTEARQIEAKWNQGGTHTAEALRRLMMLKPKLAYQAKREKSVTELKDVLTEVIDEIEKAPIDQRNIRFNRFMSLFEAILAYHRALGGN